mgnify:CR=1 FL=1
MGSLLIEVRKYPRFKLVLVWLALTGFEVLWVCAALAVSLVRETVITKTILYPLAQASQIHAFLFPISVAVLASRVSVLEHDASSYKLIFTTSISPARLFVAKFTALQALCCCACVVHVATIAFVAGSAQIPIDAGYMSLYALGCVVAGLPMGAIQLYLGLRYARQQVTLLVGGVGGLIGSLAQLMPRWVSLLLPWQYSALLSPAVVEAQGGTIVALHFPSGYVGDMLLVVAIGLVLPCILAKLFEYNVMR